MQVGNRRLPFFLRDPKCPALTPPHGKEPRTEEGDLAQMATGTPAPRYDFVCEPVPEPSKFSPGKPVGAFATPVLVQVMSA